MSRTTAQAVVDPHRNTSPMPARFLRRACECGRHTPGGGLCERCSQGRGQNLMQRSATGSAPAGAVPTLVNEVLRSPGVPLDPGTRTFMEPRFGRDFSAVRVHTDTHAAASAFQVGAHAYTVGDDIVFGEGKFEPDTRPGKKLIAHELTHVAQNTGHSSIHRLPSIDPPDTSPTPGGSSDATTGLLQVIADVERVRSRTLRVRDRETLDKEVRGHLDTLEATLQRLREVASGDDDQLKRRVLSGFARPALAQAEARLGGSPGGGPKEAGIPSPPKTRIARSSIRVSHPQDAAEMEAVDVAERIVSGGTAHVSRGPANDVVHRQVAEALMSAGTFVLAADAEAAPIEGSIGPPGWVAAGVFAMVGVALFGAGYVLMSSRGNVADTGVMDEVYRLIEAAKLAGMALTVCEALARIMAAAEAVRDKAKILKIKATQKAHNCRHSRNS